MALLIIILSFLLTAVWFARYLVKQDKGEREPVKALWAAFGYGVLGVIIASVLEGFLVPDVFSHPVNDIGLVARAAIGVGVIEELAKALPVMFFIYRKRYFNEHTDGVIYFALAGLGFGLPENILYTLEFGAGAGIARLILTPLFHAATTALIGYALIKVKLDGASKSSVAAMVVAAIGLHMMYDFGLLTRRPGLVLTSLAIALLLGVALFPLYRHARKLDQVKGLSAVGNNSFCRTCGKPNPKHNLYCSGCGNHA